MPMCFVPGCRSGYNKSKGKHFFTPPKDKLLFSKWERAIPRKDKGLSFKSYVCDSHFSEDLLIKVDKFVVNSENVEIPRQRWKLKPGAVPHVFPNLPKYLSRPVRSRKPPTNRAKKETKLVNANNDDNRGESSHNTLTNDPNPENDNNKINLLKRKLKQQNRNLIRLRNKLKVANARVTVLEKKVHEKNTCVNESEGRKFLTKKQKIVIDTILKKSKAIKKKGMRYNAEFILDSLLLRIKSAKGYRHCLNHDLLPLPSESHLRKLIKGLKCPYGVNMHALNAISEFLKDKNENERCGTLIFDEVKLKEEIRFDSNSLKVDGFVDLGDFTPEKYKNQLANHALVFMYVPLLHNWVQPVAIYASRNATPGDILAKILMQVIIQIEQAGARIVAFTSDGSQSNKKLWNCLAISGVINNVKCSIPHPTDTSRRLWALSDFVHIIKCVRNNFHKKNEMFYNNDTVKYKYYRKLYEVDTSSDFSGLRVCPKLTKAHIDPNTFQKMNVRLAFQLFSRSVADGIKFFRETHFSGFEGSESTEQFTRDLNCLVDILNSSSPVNGLYKGSDKYCILKRWKTLLNEKENNFASQRTLESLRVTVQSTLEVTEYLWKNGLKYVLTAKLNQDPIERHFGILRSLSCDDHPSTIDFLQLHMLQSIYVPTKLAISSGGNCEYRQELPLTSFVNQMRLLARESVSRNREIKDVVENEIKGKIAISIPDIPDWENNVPDLTEKNIAKECLVHHLGGYIVRNNTKVTDCKSCANLLRGKPTDFPSISRLTSIKDYKSGTNDFCLTYPSKSVFSVLSQVETIVAEKLSCESNLWGDIFFHCCDSVSQISVDSEIGCCEEHIMHLVPKLILHYMKCRFFFRTKEMRKELQCSKTAKSSRKLSKVTDY